MAAGLLVERIYPGLSLELNLVLCIFIPAGVLLLCLCGTVN
jgi:hypothetical protein